MDVLNLIDKRNNLWEQAKAFLDEKTDSDGKISAEDAATYDGMENDIVNLGKTIERYQRQEALNKEMNAPAGKPILNNPQDYNKPKTVRASAEYKAAALKALRTNFKQISNYLQEGTDNLGGYLVPTEWDERLITGLNEENIMRQLGTSITTSGERKITIAGTKPAAAWIDEGAALIFSDTTFGQATLDAHKLQVGIKVTNELLYDSMFDLETYIINEFTQAMSNAEEDAFLNGAATDTSKPTGLFVTASADSTTVVTTAGASIAADDIISLVYKLKRPYRKNAAFIMNDSVIAAIRKLKDNNQAFIWQAGLAAGEPPTLLGYPVYTSEYMPEIASGNIAVLFGDFQKFVVGQRGELIFRPLHELRALVDESVFLLIERIDGVLSDSLAVRGLKIR